MKKILALASIFAAFALVACGDDSSSSSTVSCADYEGTTVLSCFESSDIDDVDCTAMGGTVVDACPENPTATCDVSYDGVSGTEYSYETGATCE